MDKQPERLPKLLDSIEKLPTFVIMGGLEPEVWADFKGNRYFFHTKNEASTWAYLLGCRCGFNPDKIWKPKPYKITKEVKVSMNFKELAKKINTMEGKKVKVNLAQVNEILSTTLKILAEMRRTNPVGMDRLLRRYLQNSPAKR